MRVVGLSLLIIGLGLNTLGAQAQDSAQICVRLYEDRGERGVLDAGDPFITRDVGVNLANAEGIIIETALIDDAPTGSSGRVCFARLPAGQYTVSVVSAAYEPTTDSVFVTSVGGSAVPVVFDVGMERLMVELPPPTPALGTLTPAELRFAVERVFVAGIGSAVVVAVMLTLGIILYVLFLRPKPQPVPPRNPYAPPRPPLRPDTGTMPPVTPAPMRPITGSMPPVPPRPDTGQTPPVSPSPDDGPERP
ncbi:hypothetical protein VZO05_13290 [Aggregatilineales bacterium SYSU G02658]